MAENAADGAYHRHWAEPLGDPLGRAMFDFARGEPGTLVYRDGEAVRDGRVEEFYFRPPTEWPEQRIRELESVADAGGPIVDVGCGTGQHVRWFENEGLEAVGVDVSPRAVAAARELGTGDVLVGDMGDLPFESDRFRALHCAGTQLGLGGSLAGITDLLRQFARVTTGDALALVDNYDPERLDADFFGYRPDPRDGIAHRCFHFEYDHPTFAAGVRAVGPSLHFLLCSPDRLRDALANTDWNERDVAYSDPDGGHYRVLLESDAGRSAASRDR